MIRLSKYARPFLVAAILLSIVGVSLGCPSCKETISENDAHMVRGYFWSIIFMMSMPFLILGGMAGLFYLQIAKAREASPLPAAAAGAR